MEAPEPIPISTEEKKVTEEKKEKSLKLSEEMSSFSLVGGVQKGGGLQTLWDRTAGIFPHGYKKLGKKRAKSYLDEISLSW